MVKIISNRKPGRFVYLPDEILIDIISRVAEAQRTLVSCALVSIQWYHVTMPFLYGHPRRLEKNQAFDQFVRTILGVGEATTATVRRRRNDLASLPYCKVNAVKDGLKAFAAPSLSLTSHQGLVTLSKCIDLEFLNLSFMMRETDFPSVKKAIRRMSRLSGLVLPASLTIQDQSEMALDVEWPPNLSYLSIGLTYLANPQACADAGFLWPSSLQHLIISGHASFRWLLEFVTLLDPFPPFPDVSILELIPLRTPSLRSRNIELPTGPSDNSGGAWMIIHKFPNLKSLILPSTDCNEDFMEAYCQCQPQPLENLYLLQSDEGIHFEIETLYKAATQGLPNLRSFWYEYNHAGVDEDVLDDYETGIWRAMTDREGREPDDQPESGWFTIIDIPYRPRKIEHETWYEDD